MFPTPKRTRTNRSSFPAQRLIAQVLTFLLVMQTVAPPTLAAPLHRDFSFTWLSNSTSPLAGLVKKLSESQPAVAPKVEVKPAPEAGVVLTPLTTAFNGHVGIEHHQPLRKVVVSSNNPSGVPINFESLDADGTHSPLLERCRADWRTEIATARDAGMVRV